MTIGIQRKKPSESENEIANTVENEVKNAVAVEMRNAAQSRKAVEFGMKKSVGGLHLVHVSRVVRRSELREGTTGRPVAIPRIWAVAERKPALADDLKALIAEGQPVPPEPKVELAFYRKYTEAMLRRYLRVSMEVGRVPSLMGRELFRGHVSHYRMTSFEDGVILCVDVERCLARLRKDDQQIIKRIAIQGYTQEEAAPLLGLGVRSCIVKYGQALDRLTELFLVGRLLEPQKCCQDPEAVENWLGSL